MTEPICLTPDEVAALREILAILAVMDERYTNERNVLEVSRELWRDMLLRPAQRLRRINRVGLLATPAPSTEGERGA